MFDNKLEQKRKINFLINKIYHLIFSEKFSKKINFNFDKYNRIDIINYVINKYDYKKYLEIGCHNNEVFDKIKIEKIGVDPVSGGNFKGTSDEFFEQNNKNFDCIFIDGMHEYKQVKKDVLTKIHGGGATDRKRKLLEKQKKGKARSKQFGRVEIPQEAFIGVLKINKEK